jgi:DNA-binding NtrC family response regulator
MRPDHYMANRVQVSRMPSGIVALVGDLHIDRQALDLMAGDFHWSVKQFRTIYELAQANDNTLIAVFFDPKSLSLPQERALRVILEAAPGALPILCHRFAEVVDWPQLAEAGAFHSLRFPLDLREARQTLGFVWEATRHSAAFSMQVRHNSKQAVGEQTQESRACATGMVA